MHMAARRQSSFSGGFMESTANGTNTANEAPENNESPEKSLLQRILWPHRVPPVADSGRQNAVAKSALQRELGKRNPFECAEQEATLNLLKTTDFLCRAGNALFENHGISGPQYNVLRILRGHRKTGLCGQHIVAQMVTQTPDITRLVDRLEASGLVRRERTEADRRLVLVHITTAGLELLASLDEPILSMHREQMKHLSRAEIAELNRLLVKLRQPAPEVAATPKRKALSR